MNKKVRIFEMHGYDINDGIKWYHVSSFYSDFIKWMDTQPKTLCIREYNNPYHPPIIESFIVHENLYYFILLKFGT